MCRWRHPIRRHQQLPQRPKPKNQRSGKRSDHSRHKINRFPQRSSDRPVKLKTRCRSKSQNKFLSFYSLRERTNSLLLQMLNDAFLLAQRFEMLHLTINPRIMPIVPNSTCISTQIPIVKCRILWAMALSSGSAHPARLLSIGHGGD